MFIERYRILFYFSNCEVIDGEHVTKKDLVLIFKKKRTRRDSIKLEQVSFPGIIRSWRISLPKWGERFFKIKVHPVTLTP